MAATLVLLHGCAKQESRKPFVARVDQALLTEEDLVAAHDSLAGVSFRRNNYINEWVTNELLYQEAQRRGFADNDQIKRQAEEATKRLVIGGLLQKELYGEESVSDDEIVAMYNGGGSAFRLREDVVRGSYALFGDRGAANAFRDKLLRGVEWKVAIAETDSLTTPHLKQVATHRYFTQSNLYPSELWKIAKNLGTDEVSFAVKSDAGYYIMVSHGIRKQGEIPELEYARSEIRNRILIEHRRMRYEQFLVSLRSKHSVEVRLENEDSSLHSNE